MQLNQRLQQSGAILDLGTFTHFELSEIISTEWISAIGRGAGFEVDDVLAKLPDICGLQLVKKLVFDIGNDKKVMTRIEVEYDWEYLRMIVKSGGERVTVELVPGTMTHPAVKAQAAALEKLLSSIDRVIPYTEMNTVYFFDDTAIERRGEDFVRSRLGTSPMEGRSKERHDGFEPGRRVEQKLDIARHQRLSVTMCKGL